MLSLRHSAGVARAHKRFRIVLIKPSHYDDDGYVIRWYRSPMPANSLASVYGLIDDCAQRHILGPTTDIEIVAIDETNTRVRVDRIISDMGANNNFGFVGLVGVQSNQYPRSLHIAKPLRAAGIPVIIGGFHVSGMLAMFDKIGPDLQAALDMGITLFAGEAEGRIDDVVRDAAKGALKPIYNYINDLPALEDAVIPFLPGNSVRKTIGNVTTFDAGRGCPFQCSFCTIINVQGRKSRRRSPDDIELLVRANLAQGLNRFFITDDNFARNKDWEPILDRLITLREEATLKFSIIIQVDTLCHKLPGFIEKCARAGVKRVFIGLENINPESLAGAKKRQNKITEYRKMLLAWKRAGVITYAGYILGFPNDTPQSILHDIEVIKRELPIDLLEFFYLTPLPGSEDHKKLHDAGIPIDPDMNKYDLNHVTTGHPRMSRAEWERTYQGAWQRYYTIDHIETVLRRVASVGANASNALFLLTWFKGSIDFEKMHPLECGFLRRKSRRDRRPCFPIEPAWRFYPKYLTETAVNQVRWILLYLRLRRLYLRIKNDPERSRYTDFAMAAVADDETETRALFGTAAAQAYLTQQHRLAKIRQGKVA